MGYYETLCAIWCHLYNIENMKTTMEGRYSSIEASATLNYESECLTVLYLSIPELVREHKIDSKKKHYPNNSSHYYSRTLKNEKI